MIKANLEHIKNAYDELLEELEKNLENKKSELEKTEIERIKYELRIESSFSLVGVEEEIKNYKEKSSEMLKKYDVIKKEIEYIERKIHYLEENKAKILKNI